jgi:hypothetical protein
MRRMLLSVLLTALFLAVTVIPAAADSIGPPP